MKIFKKLKGEKDYKEYLFHILDDHINDIYDNKNKVHLEFKFDDVKKSLTQIQNNFGSIKEYLIHKYGKKQYKEKYFLYNDIGDYLNLLFTE